MGILLILLIVIVGMLLWGGQVYNGLIRLLEAINNNKKQIDVQLDRRYKVYEALIEVVKKYMDYEKTTLQDVVALRAQAQQALANGEEQKRVKIENEISSIGTKLNVVFEQYPELQADKNALQLQEEIVTTENKLTFAKQAYNDSVESYMAKRKSLLESFIVSIFPAKLFKEPLYWGMTEEERKRQEEYKISL